MDSQRRSSLRLKRDDDKSGHQTELTATTDSQRRSLRLKTATTTALVAFAANTGSKKEAPASTSS